MRIAQPVNMQPLFRVQEEEPVVARAQGGMNDLEWKLVLPADVLRSAVAERGKGALTKQKGLVPHAGGKEFRSTGQSGKRLAGSVNAAALGRVAEEAEDAILSGATGEHHGDIPQHEVHGSNRGIRQIVERPEGLPRVKVGVAIEQVLDIARRVRHQHGVGFVGYEQMDRVAREQRGQIIFAVHLHRTHTEEGASLRQGNRVEFGASIHGLQRSRQFAGARVAVGQLVDRRRIAADPQQRLHGQIRLDHPLSIGRELCAEPEPHDAEPAVVGAEEQIARSLVEAHGGNCHVCGQPVVDGEQPAVGRPFGFDGVEEMKGAVGFDQERQFPPFIRTDYGKGPVRQIERAVRLDAGTLEEGPDLNQDKDEDQQNGTDHAHSTHLDEVGHESIEQQRWPRDLEPRRDGR